MSKILSFRRIRTLIFILSLPVIFSYPLYAMKRGREVVPSFERPRRDSLLSPVISASSVLFHEGTAGSGGTGGALTIASPSEFTAAWSMLDLRGPGPAAEGRVVVEREKGRHRKKQMKEKTEKKTLTVMFSDKAIKDFILSFISPAEMARFSGLSKEMNMLVQEFPVKELRLKGLFQLVRDPVSLPDDLGHFIGRCPVLREIHLSRFQMTNKFSSAFAIGIAQCSQLQTLSLPLNTRGKKGLEIFLREIKKIPSSLTRLDLSLSDIDVRTARILAVALSDNNRLKDLELDESELNSRAICALCAPIARQTQLKRLILNSNNIGNKGAISLAEALSHCPSLEVFRIGNNNIGVSGSAALLRTLASCTALKELSFADGITLKREQRIFEGEAGKALTEILPNLVSLEILDISDTREVIPERTVAFMRVMQAILGGISSSAFHTLDVSGSAISIEGFRCFDLFLRDKKLRNLNLRRTALDYLTPLGVTISSDISFREVIPGLVHQKAHLTELDISNNGLTDVTIASFCLALRGAPSLVQLDLSRNIIEDGGATSVAEMLSVTSKLMNLIPFVKNSCLSF